MQIFLSHSSEDKPFVRQLAEDLEYNGIGVWLDERQIQVGDSIPREIQRGLRESNFLALILSKHSVESNWFVEEWETKYWDQVAESKVKVLPILKEKCEIPDLLKSKKYADFTSDYDTGLQSICEAVGPGDQGNAIIKNINLSSEQDTKDQSSSQESDDRSSRRERSKFHLSRGDTSKLDYILDCALYLAEAQHLYREELEKLILSDQCELIPTKYLYQSTEGTAEWLKICDDLEYSFYQCSLKLLKERIPGLIEKALEATGNIEFDFVSLGCGNGEKDRIILEEMHSRISDQEEWRLYYYPIDISITMIAEAMRRSMRSPELRNKSKVKAIVGDITKLKPLKYIYEEYEGKNFFSILGNTIGNNGEYQIIRSLRAGMIEGDLLLVEFNTDRYGARRKQSFFLNEANFKRHLLPLRILNIKPDLDLLDYRVFDNSDREVVSVVDGTVTVQAVYKELEMRGSKFENLVLNTVHHYEAEAFAVFLETRIGMRRLDLQDKDGVGMFLGIKNSSS